MQDNDAKRVRRIAVVTFVALLIPSMVFPLVAWQAANGYWEQLASYPTTLGYLCVVGEASAMGAFLAPRIFHPFLRGYFLLAAVFLAWTSLWMITEFASLRELEAVPISAWLFIPLGIGVLHLWVWRYLRLGSRDEADADDLHSGL